MALPKCHMMEELTGVISVGRSSSTQDTCGNPWTENVYAHVQAFSHPTSLVSIQLSYFITTQHGAGMIFQQHLHVPTPLT